MLRSGVQCWDASVRPTARVESLTVLLAACSLLCSERYIAESLFRHTRSVGWQTPRSSEALQAKKQIDEAFPRRIAGTILMAVEAPRNGTVLCREVEDFVANVSSKVTSDERVQQYKPHVLSYWTELGDIPSSVMSRKDFISADERMTLLLIQPTKIPENHDFAKANDFLQDFCSSPPLGFNLHITGAPALLTGSGCSSNSHAVVNPRDMSFKCLFFAEVITTPIALLIMGCIVRHWRLLILPLFTVCLSFAVSALMLIPWMDHVEVPTDAIAAMGSVILALSLDYSLFLLSRFSENHHDKFTLQENVDIIKACTCRTISISGLLVAIAFFAGILLPERNLQGTCIALGFAVLACVATNVVFLPAVFLAFGPVFVGRSFLPSWWGDVQLDDGAEEEDERQRPGPKSADNTNWLLIMRVVERAPLSAILLVLLFVWPVLSAAPSLHITADRFAMMPLYSPAVLALRKIQDAKLSTGLVNPYEILVTAPNQPRDVLRAELSKGLDSLGLATSHLGLGMSDLQKALREGQNSLLRRPEAPEDLSGYEELLNGLACANRTESSPHNPHCNCCPNAFLECEECDLAATCASPEMQALLELAKEGNLTVDDSQLRSLKVCIERAAVAAGVVRILQNRQRANKGALPMSELENEFKELWKVPFNVKQANENDPVEFLRKWPSKVEIVPQGDSFLVQLAKKPVAKAAPEEPAAAVPPAAVPPAAVPPAAVPPAAEPAEAKNGPAKPPGQKPPQNIQDFLWNLHTLLHARGGIPIAQLKDVYLTHFGHKCAIERFLVVAEGGLLATFKRIPHIIQIDKEPDHMLRPSLPGGATREELLAEDEKYRKSLQQKMAAKAGAAKAAETPKAPSPEGPTGDKKHDNETLQRMLIQGVIRVLQNRAKEGKGPLPLADLEKEFEAAWKVPFNCQQAGERDAVQFLQKWNTKVDVYQENGHDVVALAKKPHEKAKATAVKAPPAKAGSTASAPSPEASQRADVDLFGRPLGATPSLPELTETAKGMLQNMKDLVVQQEALVKALTSLQK